MNRKIYISKPIIKIDRYNLKGIEEIYVQPFKFINKELTFRNKSWKLFRKIKPYRKFFYAIKNFDHKQLMIKIFSGWKKFTLKSATLKERYLSMIDINRKKMKILELWYLKAFNQKLIVNALHLMFAMTYKLVSITFIHKLKEMVWEQKYQEEKFKQTASYYDQQLMLKSLKALDIICKKSQDRRRCLELSFLVHKSNVLKKCMITLNTYKTIQKQKKEASIRIKAYFLYNLIKK